MIHTREEIQQLADSVPFWWHSIDLGQGVVTNGHKTPEILASELDAFRLLDLRGRTVLDINTWDGFLPSKRSAVVRLRSRRSISLFGPLI